MTFFIRFSSAELFENLVRKPLFTTEALRPQRKALPFVPLASGANGKVLP
jgi:hypothetical protein